MNLYFDESGDFSFAPGEFVCHSQAALICPDSSLGDIEEFVDARREQWGVTELHASELEVDQLLEVAAFIGESECQLLGLATDNVMVTSETVQAYRLAQAARAKENMEWYREKSTEARGEPAPDILEFYERQISRTGLATRISDSEFVQAQFLIELIQSALQKSLLFYPDRRWREDFSQFHFVVDAKLQGKLAAGEKYLNESIKLVLGSKPAASLALPEQWREEPDHPFTERFGGADGRIAGEEVREGISIGAIFEHGIEFEDSASRAGLQLVDTVAYLIRRAVLEPDQPEIQAAFDSIRPRLRNENGTTLLLKRLNAGPEDRSSLPRYSQVYSAERPS